MSVHPINPAPNAPGLTPAERDRILAAARLPEYDQRWPALISIAREQKSHTAAAVEQREEFARELDAAKAAGRETRTLLDAQIAETVKAHDAAHTLRNELAEFRAQVREVAIRVAEEQGWCTDGLNDVLDELGLERKVTEWEVEVEITARQTVTVTVEAVDEDDARDKVRDGDVELEPERYGWEWQTADDLDFLSVDPA